MDFDEAYAPNEYIRNYEPPCNPPNCFIGSYPPVSPVGQMGSFFVNTYFLRPDRMRELGGPVPVRSNIIKNNSSCYNKR